MKSRRKIEKKIKNGLGKFNKELVIRIAKKEKKESQMYQLVLTRRRTHSGSRYDKVGYIEIKKNQRKKLLVMGLDRQKMKDAIALGATLHVSVYKLLLK